MHYGIFGHGTGLKVSRLALGCGLFGTRWGYGSEPDEARAIFDAYLDAGGNFIDTADGYQFGESEELLAGFIADKRDDLVIATKYTAGPRPDPALTTSGNGRHVMIRSVEGSLRRLDTDRIDLLWVHMPDAVTSIDEIMRGLDDLVRAGKVVHIGFSDFPAWRVARAATLAELRGAVPIAGIQIEYSLAERTPDRELLPMAAAYGLGVAGWSPLAGGLLTGKYRRGESGRADSFKRLIHGEDDARKTAILDALLDIADARGCTPAQIALAWSMARGVYPILGPRTQAQLADNLGAADLVLTREEMDRLDTASHIPLGFPHELMAEQAQRDRLFAGLHDRFDLGLDAPVR